jgi:hypothetical protein
MTKRQQFEVNLELSRLLLQRLLQDPAYVEHIPERAHLVILPLDDPVLFRANLKEVLALKEAGVKDLVVAVMEQLESPQPKLLVKV